MYHLVTVINRIFKEQILNLPSVASFASSTNPVATAIIPSAIFVNSEAAFTKNSPTEANPNII